ncbi:MAG: SsrA-binding protein SmpB [Thermoanaerobacteraceae bacterium]|nr:SsrA-binding protein SmpB [Thermoanaerobacteraceae bacterium]
MHDKGVIHIEEIKIIAQNKKAFHDYFIEETYEAGIVLSGTEVKSIRMGKVNIRDSYAKIENGELVLYDMHISPYEKGNIFNKDPLRPRKLLLHKREISKLIGYTSREGFTIVPTKVYLKNGLVKVEIAIAKGKKLYDKREAIAEKTLRRETEREFKVKNLY